MKKKKILQNLFNPLTTQISDSLFSKLSKKINKRIEQTLPATTKTPETFAWEVPMSWNYPDTGRLKKKPEGEVGYETLRNFSVHYPIARSCIDYLKTKIEKLKWSIVPEDEDEKLNSKDPRVKLLTQFFKRPSGQGSNYRDFIDALVEDYLVIGAVAAEKLLTKGGQFLGELKLVDSSTIRVYIDDKGRLPLPPDDAYCQMINGSIVAKLTQDELLFRVRSKRTNSMYGLSPIESIIIQAKAALQGSLYSLNWFTEGNMPEGFLKMPETWSPDQIKKFERYFNSMLSGNLREVRKIKPIPGDAEFVPIKKPDDIGYERFELWILQLTCAVFGVPPQDIGFTHQVNKSSSDTQQELGQERGMRPIAQFLENVFTDLIQNDFGLVDLRFVYTDIDPTDKMLEAEVEKIRIDSGVYSVDEIRSKEGLEPIGLNHYVRGDNVNLVEDLLNPDYRMAQQQRFTQDQTNPVDKKKEDKKDDEETKKLQKQDLILWRKKCKRQAKMNLPFNKFNSATLQEWMVDEIFSQLKKVKNSDLIDVIFEPYLNNTAQVYDQLKKISDELARNTATNQKTI